MATNAITYIRNVGRSVAYTTIDALREMNPAVKSFAESNADFSKELYGNAKNIRKIVRTKAEKIVASPYYSVAVDYKNNFFEDLKSGNFYNRERIAKAEDDSANAFMGNNGFGDFDDEASFGDFDEPDFDDDSYFMADQMDTVGEKIATANAKVTQQATTYMMKTVDTNSKAIYDNISRAIENNNTGLNAVNSTLFNIQGANEAVLNAFNEKVGPAIDTILSEHQKTNTLLEQIVSNQKEMMPKKEEERYKVKKDYNYAVDSEGMVNLENYFEVVKENIKDQLSMITSMKSMIDTVGGEGMKSMISSSPISSLMSMGLKKIFPKLLKESMQQFNDTLQGFFGSMIMKINKMDNSDSPVLNFISKIFGINTSLKDKLNTSNYKKDKVDFDGITRKAIVEVIPTYLSQIVSLLGGPNRRYDFDSGKFIGGKEIVKKREDVTKFNAKSASYDIRSDFNEYAQAIRFDTEKAEKEFKKSMDTFFENAYKSGEMVDHNNESIGLMAKKYKVSKEDMNIFKGFLDAISQDPDKIGHALKWNNDTLSRRASENDQLSREEKNGDSLYNNIYNNSGIQMNEKNKPIDPAKDKLNPLNVLDDKGHNQFFYLQSFYSSLHEIVDLLGNGRTPGSINTNRVSTPPVDPFSLDMTQRAAQDVASNLRPDKYSVPDLSEEFKQKEEEEKKAAEDKKKKEEKEKKEKDRLRRERSLRHRMGLDSDDEEYKVNDDDKIDYKDLASDGSNDAAIRDRIVAKQKQLSSDRKAIQENKQAGVLSNLNKKLKESNSVFGKFNVITDSLNELSKKPIKFLANTLQRADERMYELIYGKDGSAKNPEDKSFFQQMMENMKNQFSRLNTWIDEHLLNPMSDKLDPKYLKEKFNKIFEKIFGKSMDEIFDGIKKKLFGEVGEDGKRTGGLFGDLIQDTHEEFGKAWKWVKDSFKEVAGDFLGGFFKNYKKNKEETEEEKQERITKVLGPLGYSNPKSEVDKMLMDQLAKERTAREQLMQAYPDPTHAVPKMLQDVQNKKEKDKEFYSNPIMDTNKMLKDRLNDEALQRKLLNVRHQNNPKAQIENTLGKYKQINEDIKYNNRLENLGLDNYKKKLSYDAKETSKKRLSNKYKDDYEKTTAHMKYTDNLYGGEYGHNNNINDMPKHQRDKEADKKLQFTGGRSLKEIQQAILEAKNKGKDIPTAHNGMTMKDDYGLAVLTKGELVVPKGIKFFGKYADGTEGAGEESEEKKDSGLGEMYDFKQYRADVKSEIANMFKVGKERLFGNSDDKEKKNYEKMMDDLFENTRVYAPKMIVGSVIGGGVSLVGGLIGGPLLGAAMGASIGLIQKSQAVQNWLFGEQNKEGDYKGGVLPEGVTNFIKKQFPDMARYGVVGAITSLIPFVPGGPVSGMILGSTIGFLKNSEKVQNFLFNGDEGSGLLNMSKDEFTKKVQNAMPKIGAGALVGLAIGPFGIAGNLILGSAIGYASSTNKFKDFMFGAEDENGERHGGILDSIKETIIDPLKEFSKDAADRLKTWLHEKIIEPVTKAIKPIGRQITVSITNMFNMVGRGIVKMFSDNVGVPLNKFIEAKVIKPFTNAFKTIFGFLLKPASWALSAPSKMIGKVGDHLRKGQIKKGYADYMSAAERVDFREDNNMGFGDKFADFDQSLMRMNEEDMQLMKSAFNYINNPDKEAKKAKKQSQKDVRDKLFNTEGIDYDQAKYLFNAFKSQKFDRAKNRLDLMGLSEDKVKELSDLIDEQGSVYSEASDKRKDTGKMQDRVAKIMKRYGIKDIDFKDGGNVWKYEDLLDKELKTRKKGKEEVDPIIDQSRKQHSEIVDLLDSVIHELRKINDPKYTKDEQDMWEKTKSGRRKTHSTIFGFSKASKLIPGRGGQPYTDKDENSKDDAGTTKDQEEAEDNQIDSYALGGIVQRTGLAVLTKGERVIPVEQNPYYNGPIDPKEVQRQKEDDVIRRLMSNKKVQFFGKYADGTDSVDDHSDEENVNPVVDALNQLNDQNHDGQPDVDSDGFTTGPSGGRKTVTDAEGNVVSFIRSQSGDISTDTSDSTTRATLQRRDKKTGILQGILDKMNSIADNMGTPDTSAFKEETWFDKIKSALEGFATIAVPTLVAGLTAYIADLNGVLDNVKTQMTKFTDKVKEVFDTFIDWLKDALGISGNEDGEGGDEGGDGEGGTGFVWRLAKALRNAIFKGEYFSTIRGQATDKVVKGGKALVKGGKALFNKATSGVTRALDSTGLTSNANRAMNSEISQTLDDALTTSSGKSYSVKSANALAEKYAKVTGRSTDDVIEQLLHGNLTIDELLQSNSLADKSARLLENAAGRENWGGAIRSDELAQSNEATKAAKADLAEKNPLKRYKDSVDESLGKYAEKNGAKNSKKTTKALVTLSDDNVGLMNDLKNPINKSNAKIAKYQKALDGSGDAADKAAWQKKIDKEKAKLKQSVDPQRLQEFQNEFDDVAKEIDDLLTNGGVKGVKIQGKIDKLEAQLASETDPKKIAKLQKQISKFKGQIDDLITSGKAPTTFMQKIKANVGNTLDAATGRPTQTLGNFKDSINETDSLFSIIKKGITAIKDHFAKRIENLTKPIADVFKIAKNALDNTKIVKGIKEAADKLVAKVIEAGGHMLGFADTALKGVKEGVENLVKKFNNNKIVKAIKKGLNVGKNTVETIGKIGKAGKTIVDKATPGFGKRTLNRAEDVSKMTKKSEELQKQIDEATKKSKKKKLEKKKTKLDKKLEAKQEKLNRATTENVDDAMKKAEEKAAKNTDEVAKTGTDAIKDAEKAAANSADDALKAGAGSADNAIKAGADAAQNAADYSLKGAGKQAVEEGAEAAGKAALKEGTEAAAKSGINKLLTGAWKGVVGKLPEKWAVALSKGMAKIETSMTKKILTKGGKILKGLIIPTPDPITIAFFVADFVSGYQRAHRIWGVTESSMEMTVGKRCIAGLTNAILGLSIIGALIPAQSLLDIFVSVCGKLLGTDQEKLDEAREQSQAEVDQYNAQNNTKLSIEEYDKQVGGEYSVFEKIWESKPVQTVKNVIGGKLKEVGAAILKVVNTVWDSITTLGTFVKDNAIKIFKIGTDQDYEAMDIINTAIQEDDPLKGFKKAILTVMRVLSVPVVAVLRVGTIAYEGIKDKWDYLKNGFMTIGTGIATNTKATWSMALKGDITGVTDYLGSYEKQNDGISGAVIQIGTMVTGLGAIIASVFAKVFIFVKDNIGGFLSNLFTSVKNIAVDFKDTVKYAWDGDIKKYFDFNADNTDGTGASSLQVIIRGVSRIFLMPEALMLSLFHQAAKLLLKFTDKLRSMTGTDKEVKSIEKFEKNEGDMSWGDYFTSYDKDEDDTGITIVGRVIMRVIYSPVLLVKKAFNAIKEKITTVVEKIKGTFSNVLGALGLDKLFGKEKDKGLSAWEKLEKSGIPALLKKALGGILSFIGTIISTVVKGLAWAVGKGFKVIKKGIEIVATVGSTIAGALSKVFGFIGDVVGGVVDFVSSIGKKLGFGKKAEDKKKVDAYAKGGTVLRTGLAVLTKGEKIIPVEQNPDYHGNIDPKSVQIKKEQAIANNYLKSPASKNRPYFGEYAEGGEVSEEDTDNIDDAGSDADGATGKLDTVKSAILGALKVVTLPFRIVKKAFSGIAKNVGKMLGFIKQDLKIMWSINKRFAKLSYESDLDGIWNNDIEFNPENPMGKLLNVQVFLCKIPWATITIVKKAFGGIAKAIGKVFELIVIDVKAMWNINKDLAEYAWNGKIMDILKYKVEVNDDNPIGGLIKVQGFLAKIPWTVIGIFKKAFGGIAKAIGKVFELIVIDVKAMWNINKDLAEYAWNGKIMDILKYKVEVDDDNPIGGLIKVQGFLTKIPWTVIGIFKKVFGGVAKTIGKVFKLIKIDVKAMIDINIDLYKYAMDGKIMDVLKYKVEVNDDNPIGGLIKVQTFLTKIPFTALAIFRKVFGRMAKVIGKAFNLIKIDVKAMIDVNIDLYKYAMDGKIMDVLKYRVEVNDDNPIGGLIKVQTFLTKIPFTVLAIFRKVFKSVAKVIGDVIEKGKDAIDIDRFNEKLSKYKDGSYGLSGYWSVDMGGGKADDGFWGVISNIAGMIYKIINFPITLIATIIYPFKNIIDDIKEKIFSGLKGLVDKLPQAVKDFLPDWFTDIFNGSGSKIVTDITNKRDKRESDYRNKVVSFLENISNGFSGGASGLPSVGSSKNKFSHNEDNGTFISQTNGKYANTKFNSSEDTKQQTIETDGCAPAVAAMTVNRAANNTLTVKDAANYAIKSGHKVKNSGTDAGYFEDVLGNYGVQTKYINNTNAANKKSIINSLSNGDNVVLLGTDYNNDSKSKSPFGSNGHYVLATGIDKSGNIVVNDPEASTAGKKYNKKILNNVTLGIATHSTASGSKISGAVKSAKNSILRNYVGGSTLAEKTISIISANEGNYGTVTPNDNGKGLSIGKIQWHNGRAKDLLQMICNADPSLARNTLGTSLYNEVMGGSSWEGRVLSSSEASAVSNLIDTDIGHKCQDELNNSDVQGYLDNGSGYGVTDSKALMYYADLYNQSPASAQRTLQSAIATAGTASGVTLDILHNAALNDYIMGQYPTRRNNTYAAIGGADISDVNGVSSNSSDSSSSSTTSTTTTKTSSGLAGALDIFGDNSITKKLTKMNGVGDDIYANWGKSKASKLLGFYSEEVTSSGNNGSTSEGKTTGERIANTAKQYEGKIDYVWGGTDLTTGGAGADCSGFVYRIIQKFGFSGGRSNSSSMAASDAYGPAVGREDVQAGDLLFFGNPVSHTAIAISNSQMIEMQQDGTKCMISAIDGRGFTLARRFADIAPNPNGDVNIGMGSGISNKINTGTMKLHRRLNKLSTKNAGAHLTNKINSIAGKLNNNSISSVNRTGSGSGIYNRISTGVSNMKQSNKNISGVRNTYIGSGMNISNNNAGSTQNMSTQTSHSKPLKKSQIILGTGSGSSQVDYTPLIEKASETANTNSNIDKQVIQLLSVIASKLGTVVDNTDMLSTIIALLQTISKLSKGSGTNIDKKATTSNPSNNGGAVIINNSANNSDTENKNMEDMIKLLTQLATQ